MKTVTLFRHAKSGEKGNPHIDDFDRPLADRGLKTAPKVGVAIRDRGIRPNLILCSPSVRTRQTLTLAAAGAWDNPPKLRYDQNLYEATASTMLKMLESLPEDVAHVMIVGHNPGLQDLAAALAPAGTEARQQFKEKLPTAAVASFDFDAEEWKDLEAGTGHLRTYIAPSKL
jgi:phosphohistidine phosphatase